MTVIHDFRYHMWIPELKDQLNSGQSLLKIGPDHLQKSGGRFSENYYYLPPQGSDPEVGTRGGILVSKLARDRERKCCKFTQDP